MSTIRSTSKATSRELVILIMVQPGLYFFRISLIDQRPTKGGVSIMMTIWDLWRISLTRAIFLDKPSLNSSSGSWMLALRPSSLNRLRSYPIPTAFESRRASRGSNFGHLHLRLSSKVPEMKKFSLRITPKIVLRSIYHQFY